MGWGRWPLQLALGLVGGLQGWNLEEPCLALAGDAMAQAGEGQYGVREEASGAVVEVRLEVRSGAGLMGPMAMSWGFIA